MNIEKLPQDIRKKLQANISKINTLNSTELLEYSKTLRALKDEIDQSTREYLFQAIDARCEAINSGLDIKAKCRDKEMIEEFLKRKVA